MKTLTERGKAVFLLVFNRADPKLIPEFQEACLQEWKADVQWLNLDSWRLVREVTPSDRGELLST